MASASAPVGIWFEAAGKVEQVVVNSAAVISYRCLDLLRKAGNIVKKLFQRPIMKTGVISQRLVEIVNVSLKMTVVVKLHGLFINIGFECLIGVWQRGIGEWIMISKIGQG